MSKQKVFITRKIQEPAVSLLKKHFEVKVYSKPQPIPRNELLKGVKWCDALISLLTEKIDREILDLNPKLKVIANYAVGFNNIDVNYATKKKIPICNTPSQQVVDAVAEHAITLLLGLAKRIHEDEIHVRQMKWKAWDPYLLLGTQVKGKILGVVGLGRIGSGVTERALFGLGMKIIYYDVVRNKEFEQKYSAQFLDLSALLKQADFVSIHVPLLPATQHLIGAKQLKLMKKTAYLINTSRGPVVDEQALIAALQKKQIAGAGLDVYETEPATDPRLLKLDNVLLTPHTASATNEVREQMSKDVAESVIAVLQGKKPVKIVNPEVYK